MPAASSRHMSGGVGPRRTSLVGAGVPQQLLEHLADSAASADRARDCVEECAIVISHFVFELPEEGVVAPPGDVPGRFRRTRLSIVGEPYSPRSDCAEERGG